MKEIRTRSSAFAARWADDVYEKGESQSFWNEFLAIFGIDRKRVAYFEKRAERFSTGNQGFIDLLWPGMLLVEQKSAGKDLSMADAQAFDYLDGLPAKDFPRAIVVSDFARIKLTRFDEDGGAKTYLIDTRNLEQEIDRFTFLAGYIQRDFTAAQEEAVNATAVKLMSNLYQEFTRDHYSEHETAIFMTRVLFLLFGDDTGLWPRGLFHDLVDQSPVDGEAVAGTLDALFRALDRPETERSSRLSESISPFPYVNGGIFNEHIEVPQFDSAMRGALLECCRFDWGSISPDVFGSMFQSVKAKVDRRAHGEHYTTPENISKTIDPLFMDGFRRDLVACGTNLNKLRAFHKSLDSYTYLDPACGCGNFLVVAYREMRALELEILRKIRAITGNEMLGSFEVANTLNVRPEQFFGIEIEEWPAAIAQTAMFLVDHQANMTLSQEFGEAPDRLPIRDAASIIVGNAIRLDWQTLVPATDTTFVFGNPPFVGMAMLSKEQQEDNRLTFAQLPEAKGERTGRLDYVACWYAKAILYARGHKTKFAFVSTNSITQGDQARALDPIFRRSNMAIDFGHRTFKWTSGAANAAAVFCTILGFSADGTVKQKRLFEYPDVSGQPLESAPANINFYLIDSDQPAPFKRTKPLIATLPPMVKGSQATDGGHLLVETNEYAHVMADSIAAKYVRPFLQAQNMLRNEDRWCLWLTDALPSDIKNSKVLTERLAAVAEKRAVSPTASVQAYAKSPGLFTQIRETQGTWLAVPRHSSENRDYIPMAYFPPTTVAGDALSFVDGGPKWLFAYLQSSAFTDWVRTFSGAIKSDFRISPDMTYCVFPFIEPTGKKLTEFEMAVDAVLTARAAFPGESLSALYNPVGMPLDLRKAHDRMDKLVDGMYGLSKPTASVRVARLLKKHHELVESAPTLSMPPEPRASIRR